MRAWPRIDPDAIKCPALLLVGSANAGALKWVTSNRQALDKANVQV